MHPADRIIAALLVATCLTLPVAGKADTRLQLNERARVGFAMLPSMPWDTESINTSGISSGANSMVLDSDTPVQSSSHSESVATTVVIPQTTSVQVAPAQQAPTPPTVEVNSAPPPVEQAMRMPDLPNPPRQDLRQELWQEWAEKFQLLQTENNALRDQLKHQQPDGLADIRVDSVAAIENETLHNRITELEQEVEALRQKKAAAHPDPAHPDPAKDAPSSPLARPHS